MLALLELALWILPRGVLAVVACVAWARVARRRSVRRRLREWTALAAPLGFTAEVQDERLEARLEGLEALVVVTGGR